MGIIGMLDACLINVLQVCLISVLHACAVSVLHVQLYTHMVFVHSETLTPNKNYGFHEFLHKE